MKYSLRWFVIGVLFLAAIPHSAFGSTLDTEGNNPYWCEIIGQIDGQGGEYDGGYEGDGKCTHAPSNTTRYFHARATYEWDVTYKKGRAAEVIEVYTDSGHTNEFGKVTAVYNCNKNPFIFSGASCQTENFNMTIPEIYPSFPVFKGLAASWWNDNKGKSQQALTEGGSSSPPPDPPPPTPAGAYQVKRIISPAGALPTGASLFTLDLEPLVPSHPPSEWVAHWELAPKEADPNADKGHFAASDGQLQAEVRWSHYQKVPSDWEDIPDQVPRNFFPDSKGPYRVRAVARKPNGQWLEPTEWSYFTFGYLAQKQPAQGIQPPPDSAAPRAKFGSKVQPTVKAPALAGGASAKVHKSAVTAKSVGTIPRIKKPSLWFDTSQPISTITVELNKPIGASLSVKNIGEVANGQGAGRKVNLVTTCTPLTPGGSCKKVVDPPMPEIAPGQTKSVGHLAMFVIEKPGDYKVTMSITPPQPAPSRRTANLKSSWEWDISLKRKYKAAPATAPATTPAIRKRPEVKRVEPATPQPQPSVDSDRPSVVPGTDTIRTQPQRQ